KRWLHAYTEINFPLGAKHKLKDGTEFEVIGVTKEDIIIARTDKTYLILKPKNFDKILKEIPPDYDIEEHTINEENTKQILKILGVKSMVHLEGMIYMQNIDANGMGSDRGYYTKQYGWWGNKYLYMKFDSDKGKWLVGLGSVDNLHDPASYSAVGMWGWGATDKYNKMISDIEKINQGK